MTSHRDLAAALVWREVVVRYKRSVLGIFWALAEPVVLVLTYGLVFGRFLGASKSVDNYWLFALYGVLPWLFFSSTLEQSATTLLDHAALARKIRFPWELLLLAVLASRLSTLLIGLGVGLALAVVAPETHADWSRLWMLPVGIVALSAATTGLGMLLSVLNAILRDTGFIVRFGLRIGFFLVPAAYPLAAVPPDLRGWFELNPLVGLLWFFQAFTSTTATSPSVGALAWSLLFAALCAAGGWWGFRRLRPLVADLL